MQCSNLIVFPRTFILRSSFFFFFMMHGFRFSSLYSNEYLAWSASEQLTFCQQIILCKSVQRVLWIHWYWTWNKTAIRLISNRMTDIFALIVCVVMCLCVRASHITSTCFAAINNYYLFIIDIGMMAGITENCIRWLNGINVHGWFFFSFFFFFLLLSHINALRFVNASHSCSGIKM